MLLILQQNSVAQGSAPAAPPPAAPVRTLFTDGVTQILAYELPRGGEELVASRGSALLHRARALRFEAANLPPLPLDGTTTVLPIQAWAGGAWLFHLFAQTPAGTQFAGQIVFGKGSPYIASRPAADGTHRLAIGDAAFDDWDGARGTATDLRPLLLLRWDGAALRADPAAMRRPTAAVLAAGCAPPHSPHVPAAPSPPWQGAADLEAAAAAIADTWPEGGPLHLARLATCLIYAGQPQAARTAIAAAWPGALPGRAAFERKLAERLACSPYATPVRSMAPPDQRWPPETGCRPR